MSIQREIARWANETFGTATDVARVAARANVEMAELLRAATSPREGTLAIGEEAADVVIVLYRLCDMVNIDLDAAIRQKLEVNKRRAWTRDGGGIGTHHVEHRCVVLGFNQMKGDVCPACEILRRRANGFEPLPPWLPR